MSMRSYRNLDEFIEEWKFLEPKPPNFRAFAFFLYSDLSKNIVGYVEEFSAALHDMTGPEFIMIVINQLKSSEFAFDEPESEDLTIIHAVRPLILRKDSVFHVARYLKLDTEDIPCIVFFEHIDDKDIVIYPLEDSWNHERLTKELKGIASIVLEVIRTANDELGVSEDLEDWKRVKEVFWKDLKSKITRKRRKVKIVKSVSTIGSYLKSLKEFLP